jgi:hypothetical protein
MDARVRFRANRQQVAGGTRLEGRALGDAGQRGVEISRVDQELALLVWRPCGVLGLRSGGHT